MKNAEKVLDFASKKNAASRMKPGNSLVTSRLLHISKHHGIGTTQIRRWKASFHAFDTLYSDVAGLLSDEGCMLLKKQTFHLGKPRINSSAAEFAAIRLV